MKRVAVLIVVGLLFGGVSARGGLLMGVEEEARLRFLYFGNLGVSVVDCPAEAVAWFRFNSAYGVCGVVPESLNSWGSVRDAMLQSFVIAKSPLDEIEFEAGGWVEDDLLGFTRRLRFNLVEFLISWDPGSGLAVIARPELYWR